MRSGKLFSTQPQIDEPRRNRRYQKFGQESTDIPNLGVLRFLRGSSICGCVLVHLRFRLRQSSGLPISAVPCSSLCGCVLVLLRFRLGPSTFLLQWSDACRAVALTGLPTS